MIGYQVKLNLTDFPRCPHGMKFVKFYMILILEVQIELADPATAHHRMFQGVKW